MTDKEILHIHEMVYQYLMLLHREDASFKFILNSNLKQIEKGYWFQNEKAPFWFINTSFWIHSVEYAPFLLYIVRHTQSLAFLFTNSEIKLDIEYHIIEKIFTQLSDKSLSQDKAKIIGVMLENPNLLSAFGEFIRKYKPLIDNYLKENNLLNKTTITDEQFKTSVKLVESYRKKFKGIYDYKSIYSEYLDACKSEIATQKIIKKQSPKLPFAFTRLYVNDFQGIHEMVLETLMPDVQWIFLTGENAYGKTSILRAIATGLLGDESITNDLLIKSKIYMNGIAQNETFIYEPQPKTKSPIPIPIAAYGAARYQLATDRDTLESNKKSVTYSLFYDNGQLINIEQELITAYAYKPARFELLVKIFKKVIPNLAEIKVVMVNEDPQVQYIEQNNMGKVYPPVTLQQLAAGYRSILTMIGDMMIRLSKYPNNPLDDLKGIVLIDEIDAHLHPKYQYQLPKLLSELFPKIQFIATTHSPIPILSLPKTIPSVVLTVARTIEAGITIDRKDDEIEIHRLNPNALLTSPIFGFQQLFAPDATPKEIIPTDNYDDVTAIQEMKKRLKSLREQGLIQ